MPDPNFDRRIEEEFGADFEAAAIGEHMRDAETAAGGLALIILLDQFPRNLFRSDARAFATDAIALTIAEAMVAHGRDLEMGSQQRLFTYLPFEHSEELPDQIRAVELIRRLGDEAYYRYALEHYYVISRFDRFPTRNAALGCESSAEEVKFLEDFGAF